MADKKDKKQDNKSLEKWQNGPDKKLTLSDAYLNKVKESFSGFNSLSNEQRIDIYGDKKFLDQFRLYFKENNPDVIGQINREDLPIYLHALEKKWFSIGNILENAYDLREEFKDDDTEEHVIKASLKKLKTFCGDKINNIPWDVFDKFAQKAWFDNSSFEIDSSGSLRTIDDLYLVWRKFAESENLGLKELQKENIEKILSPNFNPVERCMVNVALKKIRKELTWPVRVAFDAKFGTEVNIFSRVQNLVAFKNEWLGFLDDHRWSIDEKLAKKLDNIIVTNGDIKNELTKSWRPFDETQWFSEWEQYYRTIFNKLASRQLFEEIRNTEKLADSFADTIIDWMKWFPPYVNEIFKIYPFMFHLNDELSGKMWAIDAKIGEAENKIVTWSTDQTKMMLRSEIRKLRAEKEKIRWDAYVAQLASKDANLAIVMRTLVDTKFDFSQIPVWQQQILLDVLIKNKLADLIKRKAPELLSTNEETLTQFVNDLFDLNKTSLDIPTSDGIAHITFAPGGKRFLWTAMANLTSPDELSKLENLPLNFEVEVTPSSEKFFEESIIFRSIFEKFGASNGPKSLNDAYKIRLTRDGKIVEWYLSLVSPFDKDKQWDPEHGSSEPKWYMYSSPVTTVSDERNLVTWEGTPDGTFVSIAEDDEKNCQIDVLEKKINLNGEALTALFAWFVLGQQSLEKPLSPEEEAKWKEKMANLKTYKDVDQDLENDIDEQNKKDEKASESKEETGVDKFLKKWEVMKWFKFEKLAEHGWFAKGVKFIIKSGSTWLPPEQTWWDSYMWLEVTDVDRNSGKFTVKVHGGESRLGSVEWAKKTLAMNDKTIENIAEALWDIDKEVYRMPSDTGKDMDWVLSTMKQSDFGASIFSTAFDKMSWTGSGFKIAVWETFIWKDVEYFWFSEKEYTSDKNWRTQEKITPVYYKVKYNSNGTVTVTNDTNFVDQETKKTYKYEQTMDYAMFILFVWSKKLQPKPSKEIMDKWKPKAEGPDEWHSKGTPFFSINNIVWFFKSSFNKIEDGVKKHDEERTEDLMDIALQDWLLFERLGQWIGSVFSRVGNGMERAGMEYYTARDNRVWKKIERWQKYYEADAHFSSLYPRKLKAMINGKERPRDMYKIPALLLAIINKEKTPYSRSYEYIGKWHRVNLILGKDHQDRYLSRLNAVMEDVRQNSALNGSDWTIYRNEYMVKLEMKYLVDVIDGREHGVDFEHEKKQASKWSREFASKLDESMKKNFWFSAIESKHKEIDKNTSFEFAEYEYQRHMRNWRTMSAFPYFKVMAERAETPKHWNIFYMYVVSGILSWFVWYNTDATTKWRFKDICRTSGCLAWLMAKDPDQQSKMLKLLDIYTNEGFSKNFTYRTDDNESPKTKPFNLNDFTLNNMNNVGRFIRWGKPSFKSRWLDDGNGEWFAKFLSFESNDASEKKNGKSRWDQKTIVELASTATKTEDKELLNDYLKFAFEGSQDIDKDVRHNVSAMQQMPWAKSETIVKELMKYHGGEFEWEDSHQKWGSEEFWNNVKRLVPQTKTDSSTVEFVLRKFLNWFGGMGFRGNELSECLKRLVAIREMLKDPSLHHQAHHTLRYTINGTIIKNNAGWHDDPPPQFRGALDAFKNFFEQNLDIILSPSMVGKTMDSKHKDDIVPGLMKVWDRGEYIQYAADKSASSFAWKSDVEKQRISAIVDKYKSAKYANKDLYTLAEDLHHHHGTPNEFREYLNLDPVSKHTDTRADLTTAIWPWGRGWKGTKGKTIKAGNLNLVKWWLYDNLWDVPHKNWHSSPLSGHSDDEELY